GVGEQVKVAQLMRVQRTRCQYRMQCAVRVERIPTDDLGRCDPGALGTGELAAQRIQEWRIEQRGEARCEQRGLWAGRADPQVVGRGQAEEDGAARTWQDPSPRRAWRQPVHALSMHRLEEFLPAAAVR